MKIKSTVWISCIVIPLALIVLLLRFRVERTAVAREAAQAAEKREAAVAPSDQTTVDSSAPKERVTDGPKTGSDDVAIPETEEPEVAKPANNFVSDEHDDFVPAKSGYPIRSIRKAEVRVKDVPTQVQIKKAEVHFTEAYRLKNQDAARIAAELKKLVPELDITYDPATESVVIQEMTPKMREFVNEVIQRLAAARQEPLTPQANKNNEALQRYRAAEEGVRGFPYRIDNLTPQADGSPEQKQVRDANRAALQDSVRRAFEARQELLKQELAEFRGRLNRLAKTLEDRERAKSTIIERRVDELLNPNLRWDAAGNTPSRLGLPMGSNERHYPLVGIGTLVDGKLMPSATGSNARPGGMSGSKPEHTQAAKELEFLSQYPRFSGLSLDMTEGQFRAFLEQQKLAPQLSIPQDGQLNYSVPLGDGNRLTVMFGLDGKCRGIERISGAAPSPILPHPASPAPVRAEKVVAKIFRLEQVDAASVAKTLQELASEKPFSARISADAASNSVIVFANQDDMHVIEAIIIRLDMAPESPSPKATPKPSSDSSATPATSGTSNTAKP